MITCSGVLGVFLGLFGWQDSGLNAKPFLGPRRIRANCRSRYCFQFHESCFGRCVFFCEYTTSLASSNARIDSLGVTVGGDGASFDAAPEDTESSNSSRVKCC